MNKTARAGLLELSTCTDIHSERGTLIHGSGVDIRKRAALLKLGYITIDEVYHRIRLTEAGRVALYEETGK